MRVADLRNPFKASPLGPPVALRASVPFYAMTRKDIIKRKDYNDNMHNDKVIGSSNGFSTCFLAKKTISKQQ